MDLTDDALPAIRGMRLLLLDVDGVLTDGGLVLIDDDRESKIFDVQDGMGVTLALAAGLKVGILTGRRSEVVVRRAEELDIEYVWQGADDKGKVLDDILDEVGCREEQVAYMADDVQDLPVLRRVGLAIAPENARPEVKRECDLVTRSVGGNGAVREAIDRLLEVRGEREAVYERAARGEL